MKGYYDHAGSHKLLKQMWLCWHGRPGILNESLLLVVIVTGFGYYLQVYFFGIRGNRQTYVRVSVIVGP